MRKLGLDDEGIAELMAVVDLFSGFNNLRAAGGLNLTKAQQCIQSGDKAEPPGLNKSGFCFDCVKSPIPFVPEST